MVPLSKFQLGSCCHTSAMRMSAQAVDFSYVGHSLAVGAAVFFFVRGDAAAGGVSTFLWTSHKFSPWRLPHSQPKNGFSRLRCPSGLKGWQRVICGISEGARQTGDPAGCHL